MTKKKKVELGTLQDTLKEYEDRADLIAYTMDEAQNEADELDKWLGRQLKTWRTHTGLTLRAVGDLLGYSHAFIDDVERGRRSPQTVVSKLLEVYKKIGKSDD